MHPLCGVNLPNVRVIFDGAALLAAPLATLSRHLRDVIRLALSKRCEGVANLG
jgi:hypothetical protein